MVFCREVSFLWWLELLFADFDIDLGADFRACRRDIRHAHTPVQARRKGAACYFADAFPVLED